MSASVEKSYVKALYPRYARAVKARFDAAAGSATPVFERLVHFWSNHFTVSGVKPIAIALPPSFERDAIRPFVTGRFADMLLAVTQQPAMLIYLDNTQSIGANSRWARHPPRRSRAAAAFPHPTGLNENLAREILELHTVGVHGGYEQADVTRFANIITGWQVLTPRQLLRFAARWAGIGTDLFYFNTDAHEPGEQVVLGKIYRAGGVEQGEAVLQDLARHPATARFIATKLARHFVADSPEPAVVDNLTTVFRDTDGDLAAVTHALVDAPQVWAQPRTKLKAPEEYLISAVRTLGGPPLHDQPVVASLSAMGQRPYMSPGPDGWSDQQDTWLSPDGVWKRIQWAQLAGRALAGAIAQPDVYASAVFGATLSASTRSAISRAESPAQGLNPPTHVTGVHASMITPNRQLTRKAPMTLNRRVLLKSGVGLAAAAIALPRITFASPASDRRLVVIVQRGGMDGLAALPAYGDPNFEAARTASSRRPPDPDLTFTAPRPPLQSPADSGIMTGISNGFSSFGMDVAAVPGRISKLGVNATIRLRS